MEDKTRILLIDDEEIALKNLQHVLQKAGYPVRTTSSGETALKLLKGGSFDLVLTDLKMKKVDGMQILKTCKELYPDTEVIMITGYATVESAIESMRLGAYHYITKPFKLDEVRKVVREAAEKLHLKRENRMLRESLETFRDKVKIVTQDPKMLRLLDTARDVAPTDCNILITGESGTGKELVARYLNLYSKRSAGPFIAINCGAFTEDLLGNELFGHEKGAYTGADFLKKGLIEFAEGGTLFLDEITEMSMSMQVKLLRVIQEKEYLRIGGNEPVAVNVRFLAATNRNVQEAIASGELRQDLYYRLNVVTLHLPPLSERRGDIPLLCHLFLRKYAAVMGKEVTEISEEVLGLLNGYSFPGNVRELENIIERGVALAKGETLEVGNLPEDLRDLNIRTFRRDGDKVPSLEDQEKAYIQWVLKKAEGNKTLAAQMLGIDRVSLWRKIKKYNIENE
jgi:DNA-binding NtrC family response regulator